MILFVAMPPSRGKQVTAPQETVPAHIRKRRFRNVIDDAGIVKIQGRKRLVLQDVDLRADRLAQCGESTHGWENIATGQRDSYFDGFTLTGRLASCVTFDR